mgnify:CR=1 FL=1
MCSVHGASYARTDNLDILQDQLASVDNVAVCQGGEWEGPEARLPFTTAIVCTITDSLVENSVRMWEGGVEGVGAAIRLP